MGRSARNVTPASTFGGAGSLPAKKGRLVHVEVSGIRTRAAMETYARSSKAFIVPVEELSSQMQKFQRMGAKIARTTAI